HVGAQRVRDPRLPPVLGHHESTSDDPGPHARHGRQVRRDPPADRPDDPSRDPWLEARDLPEQFPSADVGGTGAVHASRGRIPPAPLRPLTPGQFPPAKCVAGYARSRDLPRMMPAAIRWAIRSGSGRTPRTVARRRASCTAVRSEPTYETQRVPWPTRMASTR